MKNLFLFILLFFLLYSCEQSVTKQDYGELISIKLLQTPGFVQYFADQYIYVKSDTGSVRIINSEPPPLYIDTLINIPQSEVLNIWQDLNILIELNEIFAMDDSYLNKDSIADLPYDILTVTTTNSTKLIKVEKNQGNEKLNEILSYLKGKIEYYRNIYF